MKVGAIAPAIHLDDDALEGLDALFFALDHLDLEAQRVADAEDREVFAHFAVFELLDGWIHGRLVP